MSSPKTPPCQKTATSAFNIFRGFSRKQKKVVNVSVIGGEGVGKSAFVVRFLTRRFIGDYSSSLSCAYPHTLSLDNAPVSVVIWDSPAISTASVHTMCEQLDTVISWSDVILILYSVTDMASYHTANIAHKFITSRHQYRKDCNTDPCLILVGNKNDLWQDREVATDLACQEAEANGYTNYHEITTKESLDQVRIVFAEGIRRGLASGEHVTRRQRLRHRQRTISVDNTEEHSPSGDSEEMIASPKQSTINIMNNIKRKILSHHHKLSNDFGDEPRFKLTMRTRSKTFSEGRACGNRRQVITISKEAQEERGEDVLIEEAVSINNRQRKMSVFEPRSAST